MNFEMPDINKIRKEIDEKNAEMEKKERERIKEEYERLSEQEKPTEEPIKEKREEPEEKKEKTEKKEEKKPEEKGGGETDKKLRSLEEELKESDNKEYINPDDIKRKEKLEIEYAELDRQAKEAREKEKGEEKKEEPEEKKKEGPKEKKGGKEKEKENLEKEITKNFYDELKKIKDTPGLKMEKTEKYFQLIENWQDLAYLDNYKGIKNIFSELDKLKPSIWFYNLKKARITNNVAKSMASNYEEWDLEDKEKLKIIKNFVNKQSKEKNFLSSFFYSKNKTLKEIAQILALKDIPYKNNIDVIVKEIENPDIKAETIAGMIDIEKQSIKEKKEHLQSLKEDMKRDKLPPDKIIIEQLKKLGVDPEVFSKILSEASEILKNPEVQEKIQKLRNTIEKVTKEKGEIPEAVAKAKEHIEKKESGWGTALGTTGWIISSLLALALLVVVLGVDYFTGLAGGKKKKLDKK